MRGIMMAALLAGTIAGGAQAQGGAGAVAERMNAMLRGPDVEELRRELQLDDAQHATVRALADTFRAESAAEREAVRAGMQRTMAARQAGVGADSLAALREANRGNVLSLQQRTQAFEERLRAVLRPEQQEAFDRWRAARRPRGRGMMGGPEGGPPAGGGRRERP